MVRRSGKSRVENLPHHVFLALASLDTFKNFNNATFLQQAQFLIDVKFHASYVTPLQTILYLPPM